MMIINKIEPPTVLVRSPEGEEFILNEYELYALRIKIREGRVNGWSYKYVVGFREFGDMATMEIVPPQLELREKLLYRLARIEERRGDR